MPADQINITIMNDTQATAKETKIYNLLVDLEEVKKNKKAEMQGYNNEIKRINAEIKEILEEK
jgi:hypothetical protein